MADYPADRIFAPAEPIKEIADAGNTPFYLYDRQGIEASIRELHQAFDWMPGFQNYFPLRDQINPHILKLLQVCGTGVSACSKAELQLAISCGFSGAQLLYEPTRQDTEATALAIGMNAVWLCDSESLIPDVLPERLILRYNPIDVQLSPPQKQSVMRSKTGFNREQLLCTVQKLADRGITGVGLAMQVGSYSIKPGFWARKAEILFGLAIELQQKTGILIHSCYIGEGPGLSYHPKVTAPTLVDEVNRVREAFLRLSENCRPVIYASVSSRLMEAHGILVSKVLEVRPIYRTFLVLDAGICQYIRPVLKQAYRHVSVLGRSQIENRKLYSLTGDLPENIDRLVQKGRMLPKVSIGDYCVIHDVGCRGRSMPMLYGLRPVAGEFLYDLDGSCRMIAPKRTEEEVLQFLTAW